MRLPRVSMRAMGFAVGLIALDCAALQLALGSGGSVPALPFGVLGILPMANVLAIGLFRLAFRRPSRRPFLVGFEIAGLAAIAAWLDLSLAIDDRKLTAHLNWIYDTFRKSQIGFNLSTYLNDRYLWGVCYNVGLLVVYTSSAALAQLLVALLGGLVARGWFQAVPSLAARGVVRGRIIELDREPGLPDGQEVAVTLVPVGRPDSPRVSPDDEVRRRVEAARVPGEDAMHGEGPRRGVGTWAGDAEGSDAFRGCGRRLRKSERKVAERRPGQSDHLPRPRTRGNDLSCADVSEFVEPMDGVQRRESS